MTKKHFIAIAKDIRNRIERTATTAEENAIEVLAHDLANTFADFNQAFDYGRFMAACGVGE